MLKDNDVVEHIFFIMSGLGAETVHMGHIIISHAGAYVRYGENALWRKWRVYVLWRKWKEKEEEERNNRNYSQITAEKKTTGRKRQEDEIEGKQGNEWNVKRILGIFHKGTLQKDIIKGYY